MFAAQVLTTMFLLCKGQCSGNELFSAGISAMHPLS